MSHCLRRWGANFEVWAHRRTVELVPNGDDVLGWLGRLLVVDSSKIRVQVRAREQDQANAPNEVTDTTD